LAGRIHYSGYKQLLTMSVTEAACLAHARRKFFDLWANHESQVAEEALRYFVQLYEVEREGQDLTPDERRRIRQLKARPAADALSKWLQLQRQKVPDGSATAKAIDYSLNRWAALTRYLDDGDLPADNNWVENQIRPIAIGRNNWLFAGSLRAGKRAAAVMSLVRSARLNGHDPYAYLKDVLERLPTQPASRVQELLPHRWQPAITASLPTLTSSRRVRRTHTRRRQRVRAVDHFLALSSPALVSAPSKNHSLRPAGRSWRAGP
jgi:hypothetical protein